MTSERKRAVFIVVATLLAGILIGALGQAMLARNFHRFEGGPRGAMHGRRGHEDPGKKRFVAAVHRVSRSTEAQQEAMKPILNQSMIRFDSLREGFEASAKANLDVLFTDLEGILDAGQIQELKKHFANRLKPENR